MALTPDLSTVTIEGTYVDVTGNAISGSIRFTGQSIIKDKDQNQIIINKSITEVLDATGSFTTTLPITNDSDVTPVPFAYLVEELFSGGRTFYITLPSGTTSPTNIADLAPAVSTTEATAYITSAQYNSLNTQYTTVNSSLSTITNVRTNTVAAQTADANASANLAELRAKALSPFLLMGQ